MEDLQVGPFETVIEGSQVGIWSVSEDNEGSLFAAFQTGHIYSIIDRQCELLYNTGGHLPPWSSTATTQPTSRTWPPAYPVPLRELGECGGDRHREGLRGQPLLALTVWR